jgi:hypothetical protein
MVTGIETVRTEIGRRLAEHYKVGSRTIPDHLVRLIEKIELAEFNAGQDQKSGPPIKRRDEYLANADECERLARMAQNPDETTSWLQMARQWHRWTNRM